MIHGDTRYRHLPQLMTVQLYKIPYTSLTSLAIQTMFHLSDQTCLDEAVQTFDRGELNGQTIYVSVHEP